MTKYIEVSGALYEAVPVSGDCRGCAFGNDGTGCGLANQKISCVEPNVIFEARGTKEEHAARSCRECVNSDKAFDQEPCNQCFGDPKVPVGFKPLWLKRAPEVAPPPGPVTRQLQAQAEGRGRNDLPPVPEGQGWRTNSGGMMPANYHDFCEVQFRDGGGGGGKVGDLAWDHHGLASDIVRYRVVEEPARNGRAPKVSFDEPPKVSFDARPAGLAAAPQECRSPYCECPVGACQGGWKDMRGGPITAADVTLTLEKFGQVVPLVESRPGGGYVRADQKPTNPKDLIGVRKVPMSCVPAGVLMDVALALHEGAVKYGRHNYRGVGVRASVYYDAGVGHLMDWWEGDDIDAESGLSHVTKAIASLVVLRDAMLQGKLTDDRPPRSKVFKRDFNRLAGEIIDRHADKSPRHWTIADSEKPTAS